MSFTFYAIPMFIISPLNPNYLARQSTELQRSIKILYTSKAEIDFDAEPKRNTQNYFIIEIRKPTNPDFDCICAIRDVVNVAAPVLKSQACAGAPISSYIITRKGVTHHGKSQSPVPPGPAPPSAGP